MFIAFNGGIRQGDALVEGDIEIADVEYGLALDAMLSGKAIAIVDGALTIVEATPDTEDPPEPVRPISPSLFATLGLTIADGALTSVEMAAQLQGAYYEPGYLQVGFVEGRIPPNYLVFVQCDVPATMTQYKSEPGFELVFTDGNGDPINPGRLDIQILEVR